jgi:hypothetical protein
VLGTSKRRRVNEGDKDEGIWLMDFIYNMKESKETSCNYFKLGGEQVEEERRWE